LIDGISQRIDARLAPYRAGLRLTAAPDPVAFAGRNPVQADSSSTGELCDYLKGILSAQYPRYGYRRIQIFLERQGHPMSVDRAWRLWRLAGLQVPRKRPRRRVSVHRPRPQPATAARHVWAYDFVFDACANGQQ
jgi:hypothetical protein